MPKYKIALVSYLNSRPFLFGLENYSFKNEIEVLLDTPARIADLLLKKEVDLALVPVAVIPKMKKHFMLPGFGIGCSGEVQSVCVFAESKIERCESILLDYQSRTSVLLTKILLQKHWKLSLREKKTTQGYENNIRGAQAGLVIGDRALMLRDSFSYMYDLGTEWKKMTKLPFVFAAWVSNKKIPQSISEELTSAFQLGINSIDKLIKEEKLKKNFAGFDIEYYLKHAINFSLDKEKLEAMNLFLKYTEDLN